MLNLPNLLLVDDNEANLLVLEKLLKSTSVNLITARSGFEALEKIKGVELVLAIIDVRMPGMDGYQLAQRIKTECTDLVPVIFVTANPQRKMDIFEGYGSGAVDYIFKPINTKILLCKINVFLDLFYEKKKGIMEARNIVQLKETTEKLGRVIENLKKSEEKYRILIESSHDIIYTLSANGYFTFVSPVWTSILGHSVDQVVGKSFRVFVHPEDLPACLIWLQKVIETGKPQEGIEYRVQHLNGNWYWHTSSAVPFTDDSNTIVGFYGIATDITQRKQAEKERTALEQMHLLAKHAEKVRESERASIANDLHDDLGQALTAIKIHLGFIKLKISDSETVTRIDKVTGIVSDTIASVKRITSRLRPEILDELGLETAIKWYAKEFAERNGVEISIKMISGIAIPVDFSLNIFRIVQESLTNISRHAKATRIYISLSKTDECITLRISDNGIGIKLEEVESKKSLGIMGMKERAISMGGTFDIYGESGNGTVTKIVVPISR
jgi:PAS domain S-box-containing protein